MAARPKRPKAISSIRRYAGCLTISSTRRPCASNGRSTGGLRSASAASSSSSLPATSPSATRWGRARPKTSGPITCSQRSWKLRSSRKKFSPFVVGIASCAGGGNDGGGVIVHPSLSQPGALW